MEEAVVEREMDLIDDLGFNLCGPLMSRKVVATPTLLSTMSGYDRCRGSWKSMRRMTTLSCSDSRILHGGIWLYNSSTLILVDYNGVEDPKATALGSWEVYVSVTGLRIAMHKEIVLARIRSIMCSYIRSDPMV